MEKRYKAKKIIILLILSIPLLIINNNVKAISNVKTYTQKASIGGETVNELTSEESNVEERKIVEYDATTGKTTEVDMNEIRQKIATSYNKKGVNLDRIEPYDPYLTNNGINKYKLSPTAYSSGYTRVNDTSEFPYRVTCRITVDVYGVQRGGSGFLVGPNILLTAAHCVMNQEDNDNYLLIG